MLGQSNCVYSFGREFTIKLGTQNRAYLLSESGTMRPFPSYVLEGSVAGFVTGKPTCLAVHYEKRNATAYHYYEGGPNWIITVPEGIGVPGDTLSINVKVLTIAEFVRHLPKSTLRNAGNIAWMSNEAIVSDFSLDGERLGVHLTQHPAVQGCSRFALTGKVQGSLQFHLGKTDLPFNVTDPFGQTRRLTIHHDGMSNAWVGIKSGHEFYRVFFISSDGIRTKLVYKSGQTEFNVFTIYQTEPSHLFTTTLVQEPKPEFMSTGATKAYGIRSVVVNRALEREIIAHGDTYDVGRIGAEIAYAIAKKNFGLRNLVLPDPNWPGKDLFTKDGRVVIQARMLTQTKLMDGTKVNWLVNKELRKLIRKLREDFRYNPNARFGLAVLAWVGEDNRIRGTVLEIPAS